MAKSLGLWIIYIFAALSGLVAMWMVQGFAGLVLVTNAGEGEVLDSMMRHGLLVHGLGLGVGVIVYAYAAAQLSEHVSFLQLILATLVFKGAFIGALLGGVFENLEPHQTLALSLLVLVAGSRLILGYCARS